MASKGMTLGTTVGFTLLLDDIVGMKLGIMLGKLNGATLGYS